MYTLPTLGSAPLNPQYSGRLLLLLRIGRAIVIALATVACAGLAGGLADGASPAGSPAAVLDECDR
jgi:hypothetical protein